MYVCDTWSLALREECRLRVYDNSVLTRIFGRMREKEARGWRRPHNEELHKFRASQNFIRMIKSKRTMRWWGI